MDNRKNLAGETGFFNLYTLVVALIAICAVGAGAHAGAGGSDLRPDVRPRLTRAQRLISRTRSAIRPKSSSRCGDFYY